MKRYGRYIDKMNISKNDHNMIWAGKQEVAFYFWNILPEMWANHIYL